MCAFYLAPPPPPPPTGYGLFTHKSSPTVIQQFWLCFIITEHAALDTEIEIQSILLLHENPVFTSIDVNFCHHYLREICYHSYVWDIDEYSRPLGNNSRYRCTSISLNSYPSNFPLASSPAYVEQMMSGGREAYFCPQEFSGLRF